MPPADQTDRTRYNDRVYELEHRIRTRPRLRQCVRVTLPRGNACSGRKSVNHVAKESRNLARNAHTRQQ